MRGFLRRWLFRRRKKEIADIDTVILPCQRLNRIADDWDYTTDDWRKIPHQLPPVRRRITARITREVPSEAPTLADLQPQWYAEDTLGDNETRSMETMIVARK